MENYLAVETTVNKIYKDFLMMFLVGTFCEAKNFRLLKWTFFQTTDLTLKGPLFTEFL